MIHPEPYELTQPTARKEHTCCECGDTIHPGEEYQNLRGCWDGRWETWKTCLPCHELREKLADRDGYELGRLGEAVAGAFNDIDIADDHELLAFRAREFRGKSMRWYSLYHRPSEVEDIGLLCRRFTSMCGALERAAELVEAAALLRKCAALGEGGER